MNINLKKINFRYVIIILLLIFVVGFIFFPFTSNSRDLRDVRSFDDANLDYTVSVDRTVNFYEDKDNQKDFTTRHDLFQNRKISETRPARNKGFYITLEDKNPKEAIWSSPDGISFTNVENPQNVVLVSDIISYDDILNIKKYDELGEREVSYNNENKKYSAVATDEVDTFFLTEYLSAISDSKDFLQFDEKPISSIETFVYYTSLLRVVEFNIDFKDGSFLTIKDEYIYAKSFDDELADFAREKLRLSALETGNQVITQDGQLGKDIFKNFFTTKPSLELSASNLDVFDNKASDVTIDSTSILNILFDEKLKNSFLNLKLDYTYKDSGVSFLIIDEDSTHVDFINQKGQKILDDLNISYVTSSVQVNFFQVHSYDYTQDSFSISMSILYEDLDGRPHTLQIFTDDQDVYKDVVIEDEDDLTNE